MSRIYKYSFWKLTDTSTVLFAGFTFTSQFKLIVSIWQTLEQLQSIPIMIWCDCFVSSQWDNIPLIISDNIPLGYSLCWWMDYGSVWVPVTYRLRTKGKPTNKSSPSVGKKANWSNLRGNTGNALSAADNLSMVGFNEGFGLMALLSFVASRSNIRIRLLIIITKWVKSLVMAIGVLINCNVHRP